MNAFTKKLKSSLGGLAMPLVALGVLILFNLIRCAVIGDFHFFAISVASDEKGSVLSGNIISIIDSASVLAIIAMGMTLVTASCGGQDISVGSVGAIAGAFFVIMMHPQHEVQLSTLSSVAWPNVILGVAAAIIAAIVFMLFNGVLVAYFKIQPMIATLILFSCGRSIAYYFLFQVLGVGSIKLDDPIIFAMGKVIPGVPIPTSIFIVILMGLLMYLVFRLTNLRLYTQAVGINQKAAQLNGINPTAVKLLSFVMLGVCVAVAAIVKCSNLGTLTTKSLMDSIEMDAILAVAICGNNLGGGKFRLGGSILGAYTIQTLSTTLNAMQVSPDSMKAYKAIVIIVIMVAGSPVVRNWLVAQSGRIRTAICSSQVKEAE